MAISILAQRNALATQYGSVAPYGALFASTGPGTTGAATNEISGGSPAYARVAMNWGTAANSAIVSSAAVFNVASGTTVTYFGLCASATATTADVRDTAVLTSQAFASQGTYTVTATYTQT